MTTRQRIDLLARAYPRQFPRAALLRLVRDQLGHVDALDGWVPRHGVRVRARAPETILHICAGNLAVSACTSIANGLLLGALNLVKLPGDRHDGSVRREILRFVHGLPAPLRRMVETHRELDENLFRRAIAIIAFGTAETMTSLLPRVTVRQIFVTHGPATSLLWIDDPARFTTAQARACATDILTYDQLGCLSPQAIYLPAAGDIEKVGQKLARGLEAHWEALDKKPARPVSVAARIAEARDVAFARGHRVWLPPRRHLGWTLIHDPDPSFAPSPLHGVISMRVAREPQLPSALASVDGRISTIGVAGEIASRAQDAFLNLGVSRFCPAGRMQFPPLTWHHDGRGSLADLVDWIDAETDS